MKIKRQNSRVRTHTECAILIAIATVLGIIKLLPLPYGGSVTPASMLPLVIIAYRCGTARGLICGMIYGVLQMLIGINTLTFFTSPLSVVVIILLDYLIAFAALGLGGIFRRVIRSQATALTLGGLLGCILRYFCHVISGCTVWAGVSIPSIAAFGYSMLYNAVYMFPETVVLCTVAFYLALYVDFTSPELRRKHIGRTPKTDICYCLAGASVLLCLMIFFLRTTSLITTSEPIKFDIHNLARRFSLPFLLETLLGSAALFLIFFLLGRNYDKKSRKTPGNAACAASENTSENTSKTSEYTSNTFENKSEEEAVNKE